MVDKVCTNHNIRQERKGGGRHLQNASTFNIIRKSFAFESMNTCFSKKIHLFEVERQHFHMAIFSIGQYLQYVCDLGNGIYNEVVFTKGDADKTDIFGLKFLATLCSKFLKNLTSLQFSLNLFNLIPKCIALIRKDYVS